MKKVLVAAALAFVASTASATIAGGSHDMSLASNVTKYGTPLLSSCQFCHAPHFGTVTPPAGGPLWNRATPAAGLYTQYNSGTLSLVARTGQAIGTNSYTCLSCHDGVSDMGATLVGSRGFAAVTTMAAGFANVGVVLTNDHPVGITYNTGDTTLVSPAPGTPTSTTVGLYGGKVECGSCHDPHKDSDQLSGGPSFLRVGSATICTACHIK